MWANAQKRQTGPQLRGTSRAGVWSQDLWPQTVRVALTLDLADSVRDSHPPEPLNVTRGDSKRPLCLTRMFIPVRH